MNIFILAEHGKKFLQQLYTNELSLTPNSKDQIAQGNPWPDLAFVSVKEIEVKLPHIWSRLRIDPTVQLVSQLLSQILTSQARNREQNDRGSFLRCLWRTFPELHKNELVEELPYLCCSSSRHSIIVVSIIDKKGDLLASRHSCISYNQDFFETSRAKKPTCHSSHSKWSFPETHSQTGTLDHKVDLLCHRTYPSTS